MTNPVAVRVFDVQSDKYVYADYVVGNIIWSDVTPLYDSEALSAAYLLGVHHATDPDAHPEYSAELAIAEAKTRFLAIQERIDLFLCQPWWKRALRAIVGDL